MSLTPERRREISLRCLDILLADNVADNVIVQLRQDVQDLLGALDEAEQAHSQFKAKLIDALGDSHDEESCDGPDDLIAEVRWLKWAYDWAFGTDPGERHMAPTRELIARKIPRTHPGQGDAPGTPPPASEP